MSLRDLPRVEVNARTGVRSDVSQKALSRWSSDLRAEASDTAANISILDVIGQDFWGEGVTAKRIAGALRSIGDKPVEVTINSPGGDVFEGLAIYNLLREHKAAVTVKVIGLAASAASVIAMAGDEIQVARSGFLMIHNSWVCACGDQNALRDIAEWLEPFDAAMADIYAVRSGRALSDLRPMMDAETWLNGAQAVDQGLADSFLPRDAVTVDPSEDAAALRAERAFDILASRAGLTRSAGKDLLAALKGGVPGAASSGMPGAADIEQGVADILAELKFFKG